MPPLKGEVAEGRRGGEVAEGRRGFPASNDPSVTALAGDAPRQLPFQGSHGIHAP